MTLEGYPTDNVGGVPLSRFHSDVPGAKLYLVHTMEEWKAFFSLLMQERLVACDTETTGFQWFKNDEVCGLSFGWRDLHFYIPLRHKESIQAGPPPQQLDIEEILPDLIKFFSDTTKTTIWFNGKFDMHFYKREGVEVKTQIQEASVLWHFYNENAPGALKTIASGWRDEFGRFHKGIVAGAANAKEEEISKWRLKEAKLRREAFRKLVMAKADELKTDIAHQDKNRNQLKKWIAENLLQNHPLAKNGKDDVDYSYVPVSLMTEYAALDTYLTYKVYEYCVKNMKWTPALTALYKNELSLTKALFNAEEHGVPIDSAFLKKAGQEFDAQIDELTQKIKDVLGDINLQSVQQLTQALLAHGVNLTKTTESGALALDKKVLSKLKNKHKVIDDILKLRAISKLKGTYVDGILEKITADGILHCSFRQNVSTGRMASADPNLQNIPARDKTIRKAFIRPSDEYVYILADYSQIEVRLTAHYSQDPLLLDAYAKGQDIHTRTFCEMFGYPIDYVEKVLKDPNHPQNNEFSLLRTVAKRINFGIIYGVGAPGLADQLDERPEKYIDYTDDQWVSVCQEFIDQYLDKYVGVRRFINQGNRLVAKNCEVTNYFGRVRHLPHAQACKITGDRGLFWMEKQAQRQGVNFLIQGTAADLFKIAVVRISKILEGTKSKLVNFVHDEVHIYLHKSELHLLNDLRHAMEDWNFSVPIVADFSWTDSSWGEKKKIA